MYFVLRIKSMEGVVVLLLSLLSCCLVASGNVVLIGNNVTMAFDDVEANFAPAIKGSGEHGVLYLAEPIDACSDLTNQAKKGSNKSSPFVLIIRGGCSFEDKVRRAQKAGYKAAIIYDSEEGILVAKGSAPNIILLCYCTIVSQWDSLDFVNKLVRFDAIATYMLDSL
ncbi:RING FINGER AND PROTEASE ASSOCIATED DOMAIN-CONTAINING [Salix purpurea]|uniref:RING FINGER AND PROTEASE ASSOCIATED DOMAIN-CONTAINING n=1 Tax=Salix purpurea TaxID=77065 RepID=A0A9Q0VA81_SALPP|nr:RING FINGER AND PROTEASE ASSOCIATED DOMAIN-CONTAINING [Salix purpurea]